MPWVQNPDTGGEYWVDDPGTAAPNDAGPAPKRQPTAWQGTPEVNQRLAATNSTPQGQANSAGLANAGPPPNAPPTFLSGLSDNYYQGALAPLLGQIDDYRGRLRTNADDAMRGANAPRRSDLLTPEQIAADAERRSRIDQGALDPYREQRAIANAEMKGLLDRIYSAPGVQALTPDERRALAAEYEDRAMQQQLSVGRSAAGGLAAVQQGIEGAMEQAPELAQAAQASARQEASSILADRTAQFRSELDRFAGATNVTQQLGGMANQAFGDESQLAVQQAQLGLGVSQELARMTGLELELDQRQRENLGRLAADLEGLDLQAMNLNQQAQQQFMDAIVKMYGIDQATYAAIRTAAMAKEIGPLDVLSTIAGVIEGGASIATAKMGK